MILLLWSTRTQMTEQIQVRASSESVVLVIGKGGLMHEATIGGQKYSFNSV